MERQNLANFDGMLRDEVTDAKKIAPALFGKGVLTEAQCTPARVLREASKYGRG